MLAESPRRLLTQDEFKRDIDKLTQEIQHKYPTFEIVAKGKIGAGWTERAVILFKTTINKKACYATAYIFTDSGNIQISGILFYEEASK